MNIPFAERIHHVPRSFIREILKIANDPSVISFAGGLPNPDLFPIKALSDATQAVFNNAGSQALQYSNTEGFLPLREKIAKRYFIKQSIKISPDQILITNGSQQALDLLGKIFINDHDKVILEEPGYLGAIQAFSVFRPEFLPVPLTTSGLDLNALANVLSAHSAKLMYVVPNFQNPSGISYSLENRLEVAKLLENTDLYLVEDDPYGDLRFNSTSFPGFYKLLPEKTILLGTFSKTVVPSFRIGWVVAPEPIMEKLIVAKQAADLHTNFFCQRIIDQYLEMNDPDDHIRNVSQAYGRQRDAMVASLKKYFPKEITFTLPEGGMFLWVTLPEGISSSELLEMSSAKKVIFVPGDQFYTNRKTVVNTFRLNYSCSDEKTIESGIKILGDCIRILLEKK